MTNFWRCRWQLKADVSQISSAKFHSWFTLLTLAITYTSGKVHERKQENSPEKYVDPSF